MVQKLEPTTIS